ncbi:MAG: cell envelope integrity protein TolA [Steroidobacteraceae bacterium]
MPTSAARARRTVIPVAGALGSLALHALLLTPLLLGAAQHRTRAPEAPGGSVPSTNDSALTVVFLDEGDSKPRAAPRLSEPLVLTPVRSITLRDLPAPSLEPAIPDTASPGERVSAPQAQGDAAAFALLYGRYLGQITARIERAWMRPRNSPGTDTFSCRLRVLQDERGQVLGVTVGQCNEDARWQASLVEAVRSASPLPAPPDPHVFRQSLALAFTSAAFVPGGSTQGFEPEALTAMTVPAGSPTAVAAPDYLDQLRALREGRPGNVDLRIGASQRSGLSATDGPGPQEKPIADEGLPTAH